MTYSIAFIKNTATDRPICTLLITDPYNPMETHRKVADKFGLNAHDLHTTLDILSNQHTLEPLDHLPH